MTTDCILQFTQELVSDVSLLLLDEPTSGLDSFAAHSVVENLKIVAKERKLACLATIHQPSYKVFCLFDRIIILTRGAVYYSGPPEAALEWFEQLGYPIETGANPADYYILIAEGEYDCSLCRRRLMPSLPFTHSLREDASRRGSCYWPDHVLGGARRGLCSILDEATLRSARR